MLGIEAATPVAGVAVIDEKKVLSERFVNNKRTHSVNLLPMVKAAIEEAGINKEELACIAVSAGPGSFTGLRIGMTTAKTLAQVWNIPVAAVPTLDALAYSLAGYKGLICPILNARKNEVYAAVYRGRPGELERLAGPMAVSCGELMEELKKWTDDVLFLGDGIDLYREQLLQELGERVFFAPRAVALPRGAVVAELGLEMYKRQRVASPLEVTPEYIRPSEAEVKWAEKQKAGGKCGCGN
ncbi:tRNA (adenosine(37)-N6)-threonylcarbamoyltransferase complex dimerization subunit type 1 TsaB [Desulfofalx alkaliphila]|uniref:tRNA (adenosine(37)-N6)-threonylcarbamoyltransferase complex dimerization subunit type 1 TsaB n=1 Tax=Desulfofalx alkaliphila TaxID=105483 RepID=UPI003083C437